MDIVLMRVRKDGSRAISKPCIRCATRLRQFSHQIRHVYYTDRDGTMQRELLTDLQSDYICIKDQYGSK
jgi:cytidine deaminase